MSTSQKARVNDVDEDLDDLDDVLEQFNKAPAPTEKPPVAPSGPQPSANAQQQPCAPPALDLPDDFASELARGMESLMREIAAESGVDLDDGPGAAGNGERRALSEEEQKEQERRFAAAWEAMLVEGMNGRMDPDGISGSDAASAKGKETPGQAGKAPGAEQPFQETIRKAMDKLKESDSNLQADASAGSADSLEALLAQFEGLAEGSGESEEELHGVLQTMMGHLMSKDVLYEPLKELHDKFPSYLEEHGSKLGADDKRRYESQYSTVSKIIAVFDDPSYSDDDPLKGVHIVELMNQMQTYGSPPAEVMGPMPPGMEVGADGMPKIPEGCTIA
ncbi:hypothetical protein CERSUDRAFT_118745 [Gelatoporia subvermispora B]|uniref:Pex19-domain-containing protein n=1 Tax=Ceriporiopsis subvermispora (strain B) TaxID=914234 RepID=M2R2C1_CERS8|nr:hypothetical protein CERSUDRAFT_118745 [Gelatoporia subvermispora B]